MTNGIAVALTIAIGSVGAVAVRGLLPIGDPTRRYRPTWIVHLVVRQMAIPIMALVTVAAAMAALLAQPPATPLIVGAASIAALVGLRVRSRLGAASVRRHVDGRVPPPPSWKSVVWPRHVPLGANVRATLSQEWEGVTVDLIRRRQLPSGATPVAVYVHGGGWVGGSPQRAGRDLYRVLAEAGWVVVCVHYPFAPTADIPDQVETVRRAIRQVRAGAATGGDRPRSIALIGASAGAHLASLTALTGEGPNEQVDAVVGYYGIYDLANRYRTRANWHLLERTVIGESVEDAPDLYRQLSPIDQIDGEGPPVLLVHGTRDTLVPIGESELFAREIRSVGGAVDSIEVPGAEHAFDAFSGAASRTVAVAVRTWLLRWCR